MTRGISPCVPKVLSAPRHAGAAYRACYGGLGRASLTRSAFWRGPASSLPTRALAPSARPRVSRPTGIRCGRRTGWRRVYDLPERVLPDGLAEVVVSAADCLSHLAAVTARALGVVTQPDLSDYQRVRYGSTSVRESGAPAASVAVAAAEAAGRVPVEITAGELRPAVPASGQP